LLFSSTSNKNIYNTMTSEEPPLLIKKLSEDATIPSKGSDLSAGFDLSASRPATIPAGGRAIVHTDLSIACPPGTYARIAPRSGLAIKKGIDCGAGVVDADYRGPVGVILFNLDSENVFEVQKGDRIAQLILEKISMAGLKEVNDLDATERGAGGFGSTGVSVEEPCEKKPRIESEAEEKKED
jgi:deoxyuridine 5'-triphosphate nucleotidohydrolase